MVSFQKFLNKISASKTDKTDKRTPFRTYSEDKELMVEELETVVGGKKVNEYEGQF